MNRFLVLQLKLIKLPHKSYKRIKDLILMLGDILFKKAANIKANLIEIKIDDTDLIKDPLLSFLVFFETKIDEFRLTN